MSRPRPRESGSVLVMSLWAMGFLAALAMAMGVQAEGQIRTARHVGVRIQAFHEAWGGVARGAAAVKDWPTGEGDEPLPPVLTGDGYLVRREPGKVPLNAASADVLAALITQVGVPEESAAEEIAAAIVDWRDVDETMSPNGAEDDYYEQLSPPYACPNADLASVEELLLIRGVTSELYTALRPYVTVRGATVNLNTAPALVLQAVGLSASAAEKVAAYTAGPDGARDTDDDRSCASVAACPAAVELSPEETSTFTAASAGLTTTAMAYAVRGEAHIPGREQPRVIDAIVDATTWNTVEWRDA